MSDLHKQIDLLLEGELSEADAAALYDRARVEPEIADALALATMLHTQIAEQLNAAGNDRPAAAPTEPLREVLPDEPRSLRLPMIASLAAAAALLAACGVAIYLLAFNPAPTPDPGASESGPPVATLIETSGGGRLTTPKDFLAEGEQYPAGEYTLDAGSAEFMLTNAVNLKMHGDTRITMHNPMNASIARGLGAFVCPPGAKGFTVHLPGDARVVDLGTGFRIAVDPAGRTAVVVTDGLVELLNSQGKTHPLKLGQAAVVTQAGVAVRPDRSDTGSPAQTAYAIAVHAARPLAYWRFDQFDNNAVLNDVDGKHTMAFTDHAFTGEPDQGMTNATLPPLIDDAGYTLELWMNADTVHLGSLVALGPGVYLGVTSDTGSQWTRKSIRLLHRLTGTTKGGVNIFAPYETNRWYHVAAVRDGDRVALYVNGELAAEKDYKPRWTQPASHLTVGRLRPVKPDETSPRVFNGKLDDVAVYDRALSADEIKTHYLMGVMLDATADESDEPNED